MKLFNFNQNNSGGSFQKDSDLTTDTLFEANTHKGANKRAKEKGIYFNGVSKGDDCSCCGDRWNKAYRDEVDNYSVFEFDSKEAAIEYFKKDFSKSWYRNDVIIHFKDGTKEQILLTAE